MTNDTQTETRLDWWIATGFLDRGGDKVMGPFGSRDLATEVRALVEAKEKHHSYFIDSEPLSA